MDVTVWIVMYVLSVHGHSELYTLEVDSKETCTAIVEQIKDKALMADCFSREETKPIEI